MQEHATVREVWEKEGGEFSPLVLRDVHVVPEFAGVAEWQDSHLSVHFYAQGKSYRWTSFDSAATVVTAELHAADPIPLLEHFCRSAETDLAAALRNVTGSFALAFCQSGANCFALATDHFGIRPLYYRHCGNRLVFGTQLASLLELLDEPYAIDLQSVYHYLNFSYVPGPQTIYQQTCVLPPGMMLVYRERALDVSPYWRMNYPADATASEEELAFRLRMEIEQAVRKSALDKDGYAPLGTFLSGGTDSGAISGILSQVTSPLKAYSIAFGEDEYNELHYATLLARSFGLDHRVHQLTADELLESIPLLVKYCDQPFGNPSIVATWRCARLAADNGTRVLIAGDGGDEIFGGNERYAKDYVYGLYHHLPTWLRRIVEDLTQQLPGQGFVSNRIKNFARRGNIPNPERFYLDDAFASRWWDILVHPQLAHLVRRESSIEVMRRHFQQACAGNELDRLMYVDLQMAIWGNDLPKVMTAGRMAGVRVRFPFLDPDLAQFTGMLPKHYKVRGLKKRYLFKRAVAGLLPQEILNKTKHGFGVPVSEWIRTDRRVRETILDPLFSSRSFLRTWLTETGMQRIVDEHMRGDWDYGMWLWALMMLERWMETHTDGCRYV